MNRTFLGLSRQRVAWLILIFIFLLGGCGSSPGGGTKSKSCLGGEECEEKNSTISDVAGTYELLAFTIKNTANNNTWTEGDYGYGRWCGRMVITSNGQVMIDETLGSEALSFRLEILEITADTFLVKTLANPFQNNSAACTEQVRYTLEGNSLTLAWSEGQCVSNLSMDLNFFKTSNMENYPPEDECPPPTPIDNGNPPEEALVPELVGTYEMFTFSTNPENQTEHAQDDTWSGRLIITEKNAMDLSMTIGDQGFRTVWAINEVIERANGEEDGRLAVIRSTDGCESIVRYAYNSQQSMLALVFPEDQCEIGPLYFTFHRTSSSVVTLNSNPVSGLENFLNDQNREQTISRPRIDQAFEEITETPAQ